MASAYSRVTCKQHVACTSVSPSKHVYRVEIFDSSYHRDHELFFEYVRPACLLFGCQRSRNVVCQRNVWFAVVANDELSLGDDLRRRNPLTLPSSVAVVMLA